MQHDPELLASLSDEELEALAKGSLSPACQARLDELLEENTENQLDANGKTELESLLSLVEQLTIVKTRARFTLRQHIEAAGT